MRKMQFRKSVVVAAISMMAAGVAFAAGNTLVGPDITSTGAATVNVNQVGIGNVVSATGATAGVAIVVNNSGTTGVGSVALTVQQVGVAGTSGANTLGLTARTSGATKIRVFQGGEAAGPGGTTGAPGSIDIGTDNVSTGNTATITLGSSGTRAGASEVLVSQQGAGNVAALTLGSNAFTGVMQVVQKGNTNTARVTVSGQTTNKTFNIGQAGNENALLLTANNMGGNVTANFGGVNFDGLAGSAATSNPAATGTSTLNNAASYLHATGSGVDVSTLAGINLGSTAGFNLEANGSSNRVQVDFSTAITSSKVNVELVGSNNLAIYGNASTINVGGNVGTRDLVVVGHGKTLAVHAAGGSTVGINGVTFGGNGFFSSTSRSTISVRNGTVTADGMSVLQTGGAHVASITGTGGLAAWDVTQSGAGGKIVTLTNFASGADWTVAQSGAGAMTLEMTNAAQNGFINVSQSGGADHKATGINFAAASGSFTLAQK